MVLDEFGGEFRLERRPVPEPGHGEVPLRCLSVGAGMTNELARNGSVPRVHGHELSRDHVVVTERLRMRAGQRVAVLGAGCTCCG